jgi:hypothetical protein
VLRRDVTPPQPACGFPHAARIQHTSTFAASSYQTNKRCQVSTSLESSSGQSVRPKLFDIDWNEGQTQGTVPTATYSNTYPHRLMYSAVQSITPSSFVLEQILIYISRMDSQSCFAPGNDIAIKSRHRE